MSRELTDRERYQMAVNYIADARGCEPRHCTDILAKACELLSATTTSCPDDIWLSLPKDLRRGSLGFTAACLRGVGLLDESVHKTCADCDVSVSTHTNPQELIDKLRSIGAGDQAEHIKRILLAAGETIDGESNDES